MDAVHTCRSSTTAPAESLFVFYNHFHIAMTPKATESETNEIHT
jgi:hypothetical protein